ncbi:recombinase family protein [Micromonospora zhanjiangensis]
MASIARALNETGIPCPSGADPARNPHRNGQGWMLTTVAAILANPRYTGRQVWNRHRTDHDDVDPDDAVTRHHEVQRWNAAPTRTARKHERFWWGLTCPNRNPTVGIHG